MSTINEFADVRFKVCEYGDGEPYLCTLENGPATNKILHDKLDVALQLKRGTSFQEALKIAEYLNERITRIAVTSY